MTYKTVIRVFLSSVLIGASVNSIANTSTTMDLCISAVTSGQTYLEAKQQIALQRKNAGTISATVYAITLQKLTKQIQWLTLDTCMASLEEQATVFQCLVDHTGNMSQCSE